MKKGKWITGTIIFVFGVALAWILFSLPVLKPMSKDSVNTLRIGLANLNFTNEKKDALSEILKEIDFDVLVGLEWTGKNLELAVLKSHGFRIALNEPRSGSHGMCIFVKDSEKTQTSLIQSPVRGPCRMPMGLVRFFRNNKPITVLGIHAPPPVRACKNTTEPTLKAVSAWVADGFLRQDVGIAQKGDVAIIAGDMNTLSLQPAIKYFDNAGLRDSYASSNWRPGPTWSPFSWLPALFRIDYIFISSKFKILNSWIFNLPGSDHRGVVADIETTI